MAISDCAIAIENCSAAPTPNMAASPACSSRSNAVMSGDWVSTAAWALGIENHLRTLGELQDCRIAGLQKVKGPTGGEGSKGQKGPPPLDRSIARRAAAITCCG